MLKSIFILFSLFILCSCLSEYTPYQPMHKKSKYGDDVCGYYDRENAIYYVRACEKGKYCENPDSNLNQYLSICQDVPTPEVGLSTLNGDCSSNFDCEYDLKCVSNKCTYTCPTVGHAPYKYDDQTSYRCGTPAPEGYCENKEFSATIGLPTSSFGSPKHKYQKCGLYTFHHQPIIYINLKIQNMLI